MNIERVRELRTMAAHIRDNPLIDDKGEPIKFDMSDWLQETDTTVDGKHCGTAACLAGHIPFWPAFKNDGWYLEHGVRPLLRGSPSISISTLNYFGTDRLYNGVFGAESYRTPLSQVTINDVIERLDALIARNS
jgi:hypothetical protein